MKKGNSRLNLPGMALLVMPVFMVKVMGTFLGVEGAKEVTASTFTSTSGTIDLPPLTPEGLAWTATEPQRNAAAHAASLRAEQLQGNPLLYHIKSSPDADRRTDFGLQMIMAFGTESVALIDGMQYRVGDRIDGTEWVVMRIENSLRQVALRHETSGKEELLVVESWR